MNLKKFYFSEKITKEERKILKIYFQEKEKYQQNKSKVLSLYDTLLQFLRIYFTGLFLANETSTKKKNKVKMNEISEIDLFGQEYQVQFKQGTVKMFKYSLINEEPLFIEKFLYENFKILYQLKQIIENIGEYTWDKFIELNFQKNLEINFQEKYKEYDKIIEDIIDKIAKDFISKTGSKLNIQEIVNEIHQKRLLFIEKKVLIDNTSIDKVPKTKPDEFQDFKWNKLIQLLDYEKEILESKKDEKIEEKKENEKETKEFSFLKSLETCFENLYLYSNSKPQCKYLGLLIIRL